MLCGLITSLKRVKPLAERHTSMTARPMEEKDVADLQEALLEVCKRKDADPAVIFVACLGVLEDVVNAAPTDNLRSICITQLRGFTESLVPNSGMH